MDICFGWVGEMYVGIYRINWGRGAHGRMDDSTVYHTEYSYDGHEVYERLCRNKSKIWIWLA